MATKKIRIKMVSPEEQIIRNLLKDPAALNSMSPNDPVVQEALRRLRAKNSMAEWQKQKQKSNIPSY